MKDSEILKQAIDKAKKNGLKAEFNIDFDELTEPDIYWIIFSHEFAIPFFGKEDKWHTTECTCGGVDFHMGGFDMHHKGCARPEADRGYKYHLQRMVLDKKPLRYLKRYL